MLDHNRLVQVGQTDLYLHPFGLGGAHITRTDERTGIETVQYALANGISFIDTAPLYGAGISESYIGKAVAGMPRDSFVLASKVGRLVREGGMVVDYSRDGIMRSLEESLNRLKLDHIDILHVHDADHHYQVALDEAFPTLAELKRQGTIKAIGAGMNQWQMLFDFARQGVLDCCLLAGRYTLLEQASLDFLQYCAKNRISVILGGVYNSGILAGNLADDAPYNYRPAPKPILDKARRLSEICQRHHVPLKVAALQFPLANPGVTAIVIGAENKDHVAANLAAITTAVPQALWHDMQDAGLLEPNTPVPA